MSNQSKEPVVCTLVTLCIEDGVAMRKMERGLSEMRRDIAELCRKLGMDAPETPRTEAAAPTTEWRTPEKLPVSARLFVRLSNAFCKLGIAFLCLSVRLAYKSRRVSDDFKDLLKDFVELDGTGIAQGVVGYFETGKHRRRDR